MYSAALCVSLPPLSDISRLNLLSDAHLLSLHQMFAAVPDPRSRQGQRYDLPFLLTCFVAALLCNCDHSESVGQWCRAHRLLLRRLFGSRPFLCPTGSLYRRLFPQLEVTALEAILATWVQATLVAKLDDPIALDGKTIRGAGTSNKPAPHLLAFCTHQSHETLLQMAVDEKTNEIPVAQALLSAVPLHQRVCTADALHTQRDFMRILNAQHADTVLLVKENQPTLYADLITYFADPSARYTSAETRDRHRGRTEVRHMKVSPEMTTYLSASWPYVAQVAELTRIVTCKGQTCQKVVYLITSLSPAQADPLRLLALVRGHWSIENSLQYVRDVTFGEDRSRVHTGNAPGGDGGLAQRGNHPDPSCWLYSDCSDQTPLRLLSSSSAYPGPQPAVPTALIFPRPACGYSPLWAYAIMETSSRSRWQQWSSSLPPCAW